VAVLAAQRKCLRPSIVRLTRIAAQQGQDMRTWRWGAWHPAISSHKPFGKVPLLNTLFDVRTESAGDLFTVNVGQYWANDKQAPLPTGMRLLCGRCMT
jgi:hypothetical protein